MLAITRQLSQPAEEDRGKVQIVAKSACLPPNFRNSTNVSALLFNIAWEILTWAMI